MARNFVARALAIFVIGCLYAFGVFAQQTATFDTLFSELGRAYRTSQNDRDSILEKLKALEPTFTTDQNEKYQLAYANSLGDKGKHMERIALVESFIGKVKKPERRVRFLYELIQGNNALGKYERALQAMNDSILLLPTIEKTEQKIVALQGALNLLNSLRAYDAAMDLAERIYALRGDSSSSYAACVGMTNMVETNFMWGKNEQARSLVPGAIQACDANKHQFLSLIVKTHAAIDLINSGNDSKGIANALPLLREYSILNNKSEYVTQLEEAIARAYLKSRNLERAEHYAEQAYQRARSTNVLSLQEKTSETMAAIKRAQGKLAAAIEYYDINLALKNKVLDDQLQKNLAYQRVKFDTQDKANQLALLEQKNKTLRTEQALQHNRYQNLILLLTLGLVLLTILGVWLYNTLQLKNLFRASSQIDGLTQVCNRAYFTATAQQAFNDPACDVSLVLFDMDFFKRINDTYGHPTGDWVLKTVCDTVRQQLPKSCQLGRLGGEEFAICLPQHTSHEATTVAERCRVAIADIGAHPSGLILDISASFGVATRGAHQPDSFEETLVQADKALYLSKNDGRNRVTAYQLSGASTQ